MDLDRLKATLEQLREHRAQRREAAIQQLDLLERLYKELVTAVNSANMVDPISKEPLITVVWDPLDKRGSSLTVGALDGRYAIVLEVYYEHGNRLGHAVVVEDANSTQLELFVKQVFRGLPIRLRSDDNDKIAIQRTLPTSQQSKPNDDLPASAILCTFLEAVVAMEQAR